MIGAMEYLQEISKICKENNRDCKRCKLGHQQKLYETLCPRLTNPREWSKDKIAKMVYKGGTHEN